MGHSTQECMVYKSGIWKGHVECENGTVREVKAYMRDLTWVVVHMEENVQWWNG